MGLAADIMSYFVSNWYSPVGGAACSFAKYDLQLNHSTTYTPDCLVEEEPVERDCYDLRKLAYEQTQKARLEYRCATRADAELKIAETARLCASKTVTSGMWTLSGEKYQEFQDFTIVEVTVIQIKDS
jgi:hypothetical protein